MEDYWNVPRELIYRERKNLNDFGVKDIHSLNGQLFQLMSEFFLSANGADTLLLQCFNNAYYLCTIILLEDLPHLKVDKYEENLLKMEVQWNRDACAASFAMAYEMLQLCEPKYQKDSLLLKAIHHRFRYNEWNGIVAAETFYKLIDKVEKGGIFLSKNEFTPRNIVEIIEDVGDSKPYLLEQNVEYICERLACIDDPQRRIFGADLAIAHLKGFLQETYEDYGYDPKTKSFKPAVPGTGYDNNFIKSMWENVNPIEDAFNYITKLYPTFKNDIAEQKVQEPVANNVLQNQQHITDNNVLEARIKELQDALNEEKAKNARLEEEKTMLYEPVKELTATQNIRLAFALQLFHAAGLADFKSLKANRQLTKVAQLLSLLLDIRSTSKKNGPAHTCMKWLTFREYVTSTNKEQIIELNKLFAELDLSIALSLENPEV